MLYNNVIIMLSLSTFIIIIIITSQGHLRAFDKLKSYTRTSTNVIIICDIFPSALYLRFIFIKEK